MKSTIAIVLFVCLSMAGAEHLADGDTSIEANGTGPKIPIFRQKRFVGDLIQVALSAIEGTMSVLGFIEAKDDKKPPDQQLTAITNFLMSIDNSLKEVAGELKSQPVVQKFNQYVLDVTLVEKSMKRFVDNHNSINQKKFLKRCEKDGEKLEEFITWMGEQTGSLGTNIFEVITSQCDAQYVLKWGQLIEARMRQAMTTHVMCVVVTNPNDTKAVNETLFGRPGEHNGWVDEMRTYVDNTRKLFVKEFKKLQKNHQCWPKLVTKFGTSREHSTRNFDNQDFVPKLYDKLKGAYNESCWLVAAFVPDKDRIKEFFVSRRVDDDHVKLFKNEDYNMGRNVVVMENSLKGCQKNGDPASKCAQRLHEPNNCYEQRWKLGIRAFLAIRDEDSQLDFVTMNGIGKGFFSNIVQNDIKEKVLGMV